jgi:hypothetical protein
VHRDIHDTKSGPHTFNRFDVLNNSTRDFNAARRNTCNDKPGRIVVSLDDLVRDPADSLADRFRIHHP